MANDRLHPRNRWLRQAGLWALLALLAVTLGGCGGSSGGGGTPTPTPTPTPAPISQTTFNLSGVVTAASLDVQTSPATKGTPAARTFAPRARPPHLPSPYPRDEPSRPGAPGGEGSAQG